MKAMKKIVDFLGGVSTGIAFICLSCTIIEFVINGYTSDFWYFAAKTLVFSGTAYGCYLLTTKITNKP